MIPLGIISQSHGVYKNVALASNGSTISNTGANINYGSGVISNIIQGYRQTTTSAASTYVGWSGTSSSDIEFIIDLKSIKKIEEINFLHGYNFSFTEIASNTPNVGSANEGIILQTLLYSSDGISYTGLSPGLYTTYYLFSQNILSTPINARYVKLVIPAENAVIISGIELWGTN